MKNDLVITKRRSPIWYFCWYAGVLLSLIGMFYLGQADGYSEREAVFQEKQILTARIASFEQQVAELQQSMILLKSSAQVDAEASQKIMETINALQKTIDSQETELSFYRGIMAPELDVKGLQVADFTWEKTNDKRRFRFQLALTQAKKHNVFLKGKVAIIVSGELNGQTVEHSVLELSEMKEKDLNFEFKYFQHIKGALVLPEGFQPKSVSVTATTSGRKPQAVNKRFNWSV